MFKNNNNKKIFTPKLYEKHSQNNQGMICTNPVLLFSFSGILVCPSGATAKYALFPLYKNKSLEGQEKELLKNILNKLSGKRRQIMDNIPNMTSLP